MPPKYGGAPACIRCSKSVYAAEQVTGPGGLWHKMCLNCKECNKSLDSTNLTERNNEAYCKTCYAKMFGPKGYGYGISSMSTDSLITENQKFFNAKESASVDSVSTAVAGTQPAFNGSTASQAAAMFEQKAKLATPAVAAGGCPRCGKQVYFAEQILGPGGVKYHKLCFRCSDCGKSCDSTNMAEKDSVLFCKTCHGKKFGPKGYGYGVGAGTLFNTE
ncbi:Cysteine and glycine-rich protein 1 [Podochytrium sp. JEL0797]|nr:Cysteine and glycine-rich protein 1 [Podochytrium sp. JEL0797]